MSFNSLFVELTTTLLWVCFIIFEASFFLPFLVLKIIARFRTTKQPQYPLKTVVIVGASFSGLAAWRELRNCRNMRVLLLDQQDYFEYIPGVLRLFCELNRFPALAKSLLSYSGFIQGRLIRASSTHITYMESSSVLKIIPFDYLILATGSSYSYPITASPTTETKLSARVIGWQRAAKKVKIVSSILILGGGAVGTELAAEIADHYPRKKSITLVDASPTLLSLFPQTTSQFAERWLRERGVKLILGQKLQSWDDVSCRFQDGTPLKADIVFCCFGNTPNSAPLLHSSNNATLATSATRSPYVKVDAHLRAFAPNVFCCGDVAEPPTEGLKQAFHAEAMGHLAAENVIRSIAGHFPLHRYLEDLTGGIDKMPFVTVLSLGRYDGVIGFNSLSIPGPLSAILKWVIEWTKIQQMQGKPLGIFIWLIGDAVAYFISRNLLRPMSKKAR